MRTLLEIYHRHKVGDWPDKNSVHSYMPVYQEILAPYRETSLNVLEIGLMSGESLRMWTEYFHNANVYGIDCSLKPVNGLADLTQAINDGLKVSIGNAESPDDIERFYKGIKFDVIIEDASHEINQQLAMYKTLKPYLNKGAIYCVEDVQNLDETRYLFKHIDEEKRVTIIDNREVKGRYDDVLILITDK